MEELAEKHGKTAVIPGMEPTGRYWSALGKFLQDNEMKPVHVNLPEYKDVYGDLKAVSGRMVLKAALLPKDIRKLGAEGVNQIRRAAKLRGAGMRKIQRNVQPFGSFI